MKTKKPQVSVGMLDAPRFKSIEEVEANKKFNRFHAENIGEYESSLQTLTETDLRSHAVDVGVKPSSERHNVVRALLSAFKEAKAIQKRYQSPEENYLPEVIGDNDNYENFLKKLQVS